MIGFPVSILPSCRLMSACIAVTCILTLPAEASVNSSTAKELPPKPSAVKTADTTSTQVAAVHSADTGDFHVVVVSVPESAYIFIDNKPEGKTPFETGALKSGTHIIELKADGFNDFRREILFAPLSRKKLIIKMVSKHAVLTAVSIPAGAEVLLNGTKAGTTPFDTAHLVPGNYTLMYNLAGYLPFKTQFAAVQNRHDTVSAALTSNAYADSVKSVQKKQRQITRRVLFSIAGSGFALAGILVNQTAQKHVDAEAKALENYNRPDLVATDYTAYYDEYKKEQARADDVMRSRNILYGIAGLFAIGVGISISF